MYEVHGWFGLAESTEEADIGGLASVVRELTQMLESAEWPTLSATVTRLNGQPFVNVAGLAKSRSFLLARSAGGAHLDNHGCFKIVQRSRDGSAGSSGRICEWPQPSGSRG